MRVTTHVKAGARAVAIEIGELVKVSGACNSGRRKFYARRFLKEIRP